MCLLVLVLVLVLEKKLMHACGWALIDNLIAVVLCCLLPLFVRAWLEVGGEHGPGMVSEETAWNKKHTGVLRSLYHTSSVPNYPLFYTYNVLSTYLYTTLRV